MFLGDRRSRKTVYWPTPEGDEYRCGLNCGVWRLVTPPSPAFLPAGGAGEVGPVVDRGHGLVHQRVRLDERQRVVGEGGGGLVGGRRAFAGAAAGPDSKTDDEEKQRKRTDVKTASAVVCCLVENRREKQVSRVTACFLFCFFFVFPLPFFSGCCTEMSVHHNNIRSCKISIVGRQKNAGKVTVGFLPDVPLTSASEPARLEQASTRTRCSSAP